MKKTKKTMLIAAAFAAAMYPAVCAHHMPVQESAHDADIYYYAPTEGNYTEMISPINHTNILSTTGVVFLQKYLLHQQNMTYEQYELADLNHDERVNIYDLILLKKQVLQKNIDVNPVEPTTEIETAVPVYGPPEYFGITEHETEEPESENAAEMDEPSEYFEITEP